MLLVAMVLTMQLGLVGGRVAAQDCTPSGEVIKRGGELRFGRWKNPSHLIHKFPAITDRFI